MIEQVKAFAVAFWHAMSDRDNTLTAIRQFLIGVGVLFYVVGVIAVGQALDR